MASMNYFLINLMGRVVQLDSTVYKKKTDVLVYYKAGIIISSKVICTLHDIFWKIASLSLNNNNFF